MKQAQPRRRRPQGRAETVLHDLEALFERTLRVDTDILRAMLRDVEFKKDLDALSDPDLQPDEQDRYTQHRASWTAVVGECRQVSDSTAATGARLEAFCLDLETKLAFYHSNCFPGPLRQLVTLLSRVCHHPFRTRRDECYPDIVRASLAVSRVVKSLRALHKETHYETLSHRGERDPAIRFSILRTTTQLHKETHYETLSHRR
ncbi:uncharacterized protein MYCGRDRAFT_97640 [Zymoseptoria tritici IPO323]|uniref:Uncharacterized protein n=1 Tax=Zymoseptoria tritici (strain CBS 115943 / IPO323) TaxID=336722 RepID=F9XR33_ZYMTI|nr:uncharacterized protein MYCGRDRAFT_97640 [Zymoseptoria tritici IPO323]EGP82358.1 hypothetical protein MYCGRDRAFT_97640 [Zymoseptoria tritici IPO323]